MYIILSASLPFNIFLFHVSFFSPDILMVNILDLLLNLNVLKGRIMKRQEY